MSKRKVFDMQQNTFRGNQAGKTHIAVNEWANNSNSLSLTRELFQTMREEIMRLTTINIQPETIICCPEDYATACEVSRLREEHERLWDEWFNSESIPDIPAVQLSSVDTSPFSEEPPDMPSSRGEIEIPGGILNFSNANGPLNNESTDRQRLRTMPMFSKESSDSPYCRSCGQKKNLVDGLCERCTHIEALMTDTLDETRKVDFSGHVGQRQEINIDIGCLREDEIANMRRYGVFAPHFACPERQGAPEPMGTITYTNPTQGETVRITQEEINEFNSSAMYLGQDGQWHNISELET